MSKNGEYELNLAKAVTKEKAAAFDLLARDLTIDQKNWDVEAQCRMMRSRFESIKSFEIEKQKLQTEIKRLNNLINTPHTDDFLKAVPLEAAHQRERWGSNHDAGKTAWDWFWLVGYLSQKAAAAYLAGELEKAKHHTVSTAAVMLNWFRAIVGDDDSFRPGLGEQNGK